MHTIQEILESIRKGESTLQTADAVFLPAIECMDGECRLKFIQAPDFKSQSSRLIYSCKEATIGDYARSGSALSPGSILDFDGIVTSTRKDRDGDVLETGGAILDPACPLLWQHIPVQPIGKTISKTQHTKQILGARFAIYDTDLGRDAAVLVENGALRISHGFEPIEFEPMQSKEGRWHIKRFQIVEVSLVSVPSNTDAIITAFSRKALNSTLIKSWAQKLFDNRPAVVAGADLCHDGCACDKCKAKKPNPFAGKVDDDDDADKEDDEDEDDKVKPGAKPPHKQAIAAIKLSMTDKPAGLVELTKLFGDKASELQDCVSAKIKIIMDEGKMEQDQAIAVAYSMCGEKFMSIIEKRPIDQGPDVPAGHGDMTMGPQQGGDTDARPHRDVVRRIVRVSSGVKSSGKAGQVYYHPGEKAVRHVMHKDDRPDVASKDDPDGYHSAEEIKAMYASGIKGLEDSFKAVTVTTRHPAGDSGYELVAKSGRELSAANLEKLGMAKEHLDSALSKPDHFHPVAHTLVEKAHGIVSSMCTKDYKKFEMPASPLHPDDIHGGGAIATHGPQTVNPAGTSFSAPANQAPTFGTTAQIDGYGGAGTNPTPHLFSGVPTNLGPSGGKGFPNMPMMISIGDEESTGAKIGGNPPKPKYTFNWDGVGGMILLMADENPEKAAKLHSELGELLKRIQHKSELDVLCEQLFDKA